MCNLLRTPFYDMHVAAGATMVDFGGWDMPIQYPEGIVSEHLWDRHECGIFDVSHMGRLLIEGGDALPFLQKVLTNNAAALPVGMSQYTIISDENGVAVDDAYLYRFEEKSWFLVVNASNRMKGLAHLYQSAQEFPNLTIFDHTFKSFSIAVQGPKSEAILMLLSGGKTITPDRKNSLGIVELEGRTFWVSRTGYTGDPVGFEVYGRVEDGLWLWPRLQELGAKPIALGARDTLRLEAGLPLYGHEYGEDKNGKDMPIFAVSLARFGVSFAEEKGDFIGREALAKQAEALKSIQEGDTSAMSILPQRVVAVALTDRGVMRAGMDVYVGDEMVGYITSGTMVPYYKSQEVDCTETGKRAIGFAYVSSNLTVGDTIEVDIRGKRAKAVIVSTHLKVRTPPYAIPVLA